MQNTPKEWNRIDRIKSLVQRHNPQTVVPLGDDAFVFKNFPGLSVIAQDMMVEDVHFSLSYTTAADLGHKILAVNLSDLAAMGATAHFGMVSLALPKELKSSSKNNDGTLTETWLDEFYLAMTALADKFSVEIVGGDLCGSPKSVVVDLSAYGSCEKPLTRAGAKSGDLLLSSGPLGLSHTGLLALQKNMSELFPESVLRHKRPMPRLDLVEHLQLHADKVHALMDCSDGLINDTLILTRGELGFNVFGDRLPIHAETVEMATSLNQSPLELALWGGEDYQLLMAIAPEDLPSFPGWHVVGQFTDSKDFYLLQGDLKAKITSFKGWSHF
ncbi:thiamine-phosphate kinase [Bdellovibrio svalbardensis]|uniref:Thiamine-monophosphate kinase n=1 Tax=Bdellovibrio svalbardensis TaxID=2972972 RepID=A0ABT6DM84_9BACT|nr:thiamine-phosphate kinase [Bdellovibrio svalbardensis]MDG0817988.1 thiamine-phosphate kinase [Bdellovibrio svalbardensis]